MTIVQPKTGTPIRYFCSTNPDHGLNTDTLMAKVNWLAERAAATDDPNAPLVCGKHCQWCKHNPKRGGTCTASTDESMETITAMTNEITIAGNTGLLDFINQAVGDVKSLTSEQLTKIADAEDGFSAAFTKVKAEIQERIEAGQTIPGFAMMPGRAKKVWNLAEDDLVKKLKARKFKKDEIYPAKLLSPAQALAKKGLTASQKKTIAETFISEIAGNMTLKKVSYEHNQEKDVNLMFADVPPPEEPISFF